MTRFRFLVLTILIVLCSTPLLLAQEAPARAADSLLGVWTADKVRSAGREVPKEKFPFELHFTKDQLIFKFVGDTQGEDRVHDISIDRSRSPATIDITRTIGDRKMTVYGIYKFDNGKLLICSLRGDDGRPSKERPSTFESSREVKAELLILERKPDSEK